MSVKAVEGRDPVEARLYEAIRYVRPLHMYLGRAVADELEGRDVTMPVRAVLERLADGGPQPVPAIGRSLWLTRQFVQRLVDEAAGHGLVEAVPNPAHKRSPLFRLTEHGRSELQDITANEAANLRAAGAGLDPDDVEACIRVLARLTEHFRTAVRERGSTAGWPVEGPRPGEDPR